MQRCAWCAETIPQAAVRCGVCGELQPSVASAGPKPALVNRDTEHLRLLEIFHYVDAGISALFALIPVIHVTIGLFLVMNPEAFAETRGRGGPPPEFGWLFVIIGGFFILFGLTAATLVLVAGRSIAKRKRYLFCLIVAGLNCIWFPFGTALGVFTFIVLLRPSVRDLFAAPAGSPPP